MTLTDFLLARIAEDEAAALDRQRAECEAKRRIAEEHATQEVASLDAATWGKTFDVCRRCREGERQVVTPCPTLRALALPYAHHPDYRADWCP